MGFLKEFNRIPQWFHLDSSMNSLEFLNQFIWIHWIKSYYLLCHTYKQTNIHTLTLWLLESPDLINHNTEKALFRFFSKFIKWIQWLDLIIFSINQAQIRNCICPFGTENHRCNMFKRLGLIIVFSITEAQIRH